MKEMVEPLRAKSDPLNTLKFSTSQMDRMGIKFVARHLELGF